MSGALFVCMALLRFDFITRFPLFTLYYGIVSFRPAVEGYYLVHFFAFHFIKRSPLSLPTGWLVAFPRGASYRLGGV